MAHSGPMLRFLRNRPLCIICARHSEAENISKALHIGENRITGEQVQGINDAYTFYYGSFTLSPGNELEYYVTSALDQGIQSFPIHAGILFSSLKPRFVIHAGVCAGYNDPTGKLKMKITDVVFGEAATNYEEGKVEFVRNKMTLRPRYRGIKCDAGDLQAFADTPSKPDYHYGEFLSGSSVRTDAGLIFEKMRKHVNGNAIALDMEASAYLQLCMCLGNQVTSLGVIKGISDYGDPKKGSIEHAYQNALINTAKALEQWVCHRLRSVTWVVDESNEPGAHIVHGYYENFVRRVIDNVLQGWPVADRYNSCVVIPKDEIEGLKTVLPKGNDPNFFQELQHVQALVKRHHIGEVNLGGDNAPRYLHYKAGYLIDWARTVNSLRSYEDGEYQVGVFGRLLSQRHFYMGSDDEPARASVVSWEDTVKWLEGLDEKGNQGHLEEEAVQTSHIPEAEAKAQDLSQKVESTSTSPSRKQLRPVENFSEGADQAHEDREGRSLQFGEKQASTILGEGRRESPARIDDTNSGQALIDLNLSSHNVATGKGQADRPETRSNTAGRSASLSKHVESQKPTDEQVGSTAIPPQSRPRKKGNSKRRTISLSPKRSMSKLLQRFRSTPTRHAEPLPLMPAPA